MIDPESGPKMHGGVPLREDVGAVLTESWTIETRLRELSDTLLACGKLATFGTEVEISFRDDPSVPSRQRSRGSNDTLLTKVAEYADPNFDSDDFFEKGEIVTPEISNGIIMPPPAGGWSEDWGGVGSIGEHRTFPASVLEATDRYWKLLHAVGTVARRHGKVGIIESTHLSATILRVGPESGGDEELDFMDFQTEPGARLLGATQRNLETLYPLQLHSGLQDAKVVLEAFPESKDAATTVHPRRLEFRYPQLGIADPRVSMIAFMAAAISEARDEQQEGLPDTVHELHEAVLVTGSTDDEYMNMLAATLDYAAFWSREQDAFVFPTLFESSSRPAIANQALNRFVGEMTGISDQNWLTDDARLLRTIFEGIRLRPITGPGGDVMRTLVDPNNPYAHNIRKYFNTARWMLMRRPSYRVRPLEFAYGPDYHLLQRAMVGRSAAARELLGSAADKLTPPSKSVARRAALVPAMGVTLE
jgi:hypothetical protein